MTRGKKAAQAANRRGDAAQDRAASLEVELQEVRAERHRTVSELRDELRAVRSRMDQAVADRTGGIVDGAHRDAERRVRESEEQWQVAAAEAVRTLWEAQRTVDVTVLNAVAQLLGVDLQPITGEHDSGNRRWRRAASRNYGKAFDRVARDIGDDPLFKTAAWCGENERAGRDKAQGSQAQAQ